VIKDKKKEVRKKIHRRSAEKKYIIGKRRKAKSIKNYELSTRNY